MRVPRSHCWHAVLVVVLLGFFALTLHVSMHSQQDQQSCELCGGHFNPSHAIAHTEQPPAFQSVFILFDSISRQIDPSETFSLYRQRAPPLLT